MNWTSECAGLILSVALFSAVTAFAADKEAKSAAEQDRAILELEDLMQVSIASKRDETLNQAPGVVSVVTAKEIAAYGANNLHDLIQRLPNTFTGSTSLFRDNFVSIRGQVRESANQVLILLNGRPMRESFVGGFTTAIIRNIPLEEVERIEMVRGPGSVLYGSNAFAGAINIVTKDPRKEQQNSITAGYGSFGTVQSSAMVSYRDEKEDFGVTVAARQFGSEGWDFTATDERRVRRTIDFAQDNQGFFLRSQYKQLSVTAFSGTSEDNIVGFPSLWPANGSVPNSSYTRHFFDAQYEQPISGNWKGKVNFTYNGNDSTSQGLGRNVNDFLYEPALHGKLFDSVNVVTGVVYQHLSGRLETEKIGYDMDWYSYYLQTDWSPWKFLKLIAGMQANKVPDVDWDLSPRGGVIVNFTDNTGVKLLYGKAFRSAFATDGITSGRTIGNPNLLPEKVNTFDAQWFYTAQQFNIAATYYRSRQYDTIVSSAVPIGIRTVNGMDIDYQGVELEGKYRILPNLEFIGSYSQQFNDDTRGIKGVELIYTRMVKTGLSYMSPQGFTLALFNNHFAGSDSAVMVGGANAPTNMASFRATLDLRKALANPDLPHVMFSLYVTNLFGEHPLQYDTLRRIVTIPGGSVAWEQGVFGSATLNF